MTAETSIQCVKVLNGLEEMILNGKRDAEDVRMVLQTIKNHGDFRERLAIGHVFDDAKIREELVLWQQFDQKFFPDVNVGNYTTLRIPSNPPADFVLPIVNARGITENVLVARMRKEFKIWTCQADFGSIRSDRSPVSSSYTVLVRDCIEADGELKNKNANMITDEAIPTETLQERLRHEFFYWWKTGKHLDLKCITLCSGSRRSDGGVPLVCWSSDNDRLIVNWYHPDDPNARIRSRAVVS